MKRFFADAALANSRAVRKTVDAGHGRIEERTCRATDVIGWLQELHPDWRKLRGIAAITSRRIDKTTGQKAVETRFYITSLPAGPAAILAATRVHWRIANRLHWQLDVTFDEDRCRTRKDFAPLNLAIVRHIVLNMLKHDTAKLSLKRKRLKASVNPGFRAQLLAC